MASGISLDMQQISITAGYRRLAMRETTPRDRSLRGKARIKARKHENKKGL